MPQWTNRSAIHRLRVSPARVLRIEPIALPALFVRAQPWVYRCTTSAYFALGLMELEPDSLFQDRFRIVRRLGSGAFGTVYEASDELLKRTVAVKFLKSPATLDDEAARRFLREARILGTIESPHLVRVFSISEHRGQFYMVMEFLRGKTLRSVLTQKRLLPEAETLRIALDVAEALNVLESNGIVHRDLKPDNVMLLDEQEVTHAKVIDLGLASLIENMRNSQAITADGMVVGSVYYMCPESCLGSKADIRGDFYSLGCILYECLTGSPPFSGTDTISILHQHVNDAPLQPSVPLTTGMSTLLTVLLQKDCNKRYSNSSELLSAIKSAAEQKEELPTSVASGGIRHIRHNGAKKDVWYLATCTLLVAMVSIIGLLLVHNVTTPSRSIVKSQIQQQINSVCEEILQLQLTDQTKQARTTAADSAPQADDESSGDSILHGDIAHLEGLLAQGASGNEARFTPEETKLLVRVLERLHYFKYRSDLRRLVLAMMRADYLQNFQSGDTSILIRNDRIVHHLYHLYLEQRFDDKDAEIMLWAGTDAPVSSLKGLAAMYVDIFHKAADRKDERLAARAVPLVIRGSKEMKSLDAEGANLYFIIGKALVETSPDRALLHMRRAIKMWQDQQLKSGGVDLCIYWAVQGARSFARAGRSQYAADLLSDRIPPLISHKPWQTDVNNRIYLAKAVAEILTLASPGKHELSAGEIKLAVATTELLKPLLSTANDSSTRIQARSIDDKIRKARAF
jgi:serine/threonine protein kinase